MNVTEDLKDYAIHSQKNYDIDAFLKIRMHKNKYQLLVRWKGFTREYDTYEDLMDIYEDVPQLVIKFLAESKHKLAALALKKLEEHD